MCIGLFESDYTFEKIMNFKLELSPQNFHNEPLLWLHFVVHLEHFPFTLVKILFDF